MFASDVLQLAFWSVIDIGSFDFMMTGPDGHVVTSSIEKYLDSAKDPMSGLCASTSPTQVDLAYTSAPGTPVPWPVGTYRLSFTLKSPDGVFSSAQWPGADATGYLTFAVVAPPAGNGPGSDTNIIDLHPLPEQMCPCM
jgi:hypothetical protein